MCDFAFSGLPLLAAHRHISRLSGFSRERSARGVCLRRACVAGRWVRLCYGYGQETLAGMLLLEMLHVSATNQMLHHTTRYSAAFRPIYTNYSYTAALENVAGSVFGNMQKDSCDYLEKYFL